MLADVEVGFNDRFKIVITFEKSSLISKKLSKHVYQLNLVSRKQI